MSPPERARWIVGYAWLAGLCDSATGVLLIGAPATALQLMGVADRPAEPVFLRWIGAFVGTIGLTYLYPLVGRDRRRRQARLRVVFEATTLIRSGIATFVALAIAGSLLSVDWWPVAVTDGVLALVQGLLLRGGYLD